MAYDDYKNDLSRTPVTLVRITLDFCANTYGVAPCTAPGELPPCWNTFHTCKAKADFVKTTKQYDFTSANAPIPFAGPRPYVQEVSYLPTEITDNVTVTGRIKVKLIDEPDGDVGIDPYVTERPLFPDIPGTYFKKLVARNPNYKGRMLEIWEGFLGDPVGEFQKRANEPLDLISWDKGTVTMETVDLLRGLGDIEVPPKRDLKLFGAMAVDATEFYLTDTDDADGVASSGYVRIDDEIIHYGAYNSAQRKLSTLTRGDSGTIAAEHSDGTAVQVCRYYPPGNPFDHLKTMLLTDSGYATGLVDDEAFDYWRDWPGGEVEMTAMISQPTKLSEIYAGLVDLLDCKSWVAENLAITISRNIPNAPGRTYRSMSDAANLVEKSAKVDGNEESRKTRVTLYWDKSTLGAVDEPASYARRDIGIDAAAEGTEYGDTVEETIFTPWVKYGLVQEEVLYAYLADTLARRVFTRRDAAPVITCNVELKDSDFLTGEFVTLETDELVNPDGTPVETRFQLTSRDYKGSRVELKLLRMPVRRAAFFAPEEATDYDSATPAQQEYGGFYSDEATGLMPNGDSGFYYY